MSHFTTIETEIRDIASLSMACDELGLSLMENAEARGFGENRRRGELVIRLKGPYDVALNREPSGAFQLATDWWGGHVAKEVGPNFGRLLQLYAVHKATLEARRRGLRVERQNLESGEIKLVLEGV